MVGRSVRPEASDLDMALQEHLRLMREVSRLEGHVGRLADALTGLMRMANDTPYRNWTPLHRAMLRANDALAACGLHAPMIGAEPPIPNSISSEPNEG